MNFPPNRNHFRRRHHEDNGPGRALPDGWQGLPDHATGS